jgi:rhodanese-related sulfurtransferase
MDAQDLAQALSAGQIQIVDVRTHLEFRRSHIEGALHLPITQLSLEGIGRLHLDPNRPVVAICLTAHRSIPAVRVLRKMGYDARQLRGGMRAWWRSKRACVREG